MKGKQGFKLQLPEEICIPYNMLKVYYFIYTVQYDSHCQGVLYEKTKSIRSGWCLDEEEEERECN